MISYLIYSMEERTGNLEGGNKMAARKNKGVITKNPNVFHNNPDPEAYKLRKINRRFWINVDREGCDEQDCWIWKGDYNKTKGKEYGFFYLGTDKYYIGIILQAVKENPQISLDDVDNVYANPICNNLRCCNPNHVVLCSDEPDFLKKRNNGAGACYKLSEEDIVEIRRLYWDEGWTQNQIAEKFSVSGPTVHHHVKRDTNSSRPRGRPRGTSAPKFRGNPSAAISMNVEFKDEFEEDEPETFIDEPAKIIAIGKWKLDHYPCYEEVPDNWTKVLRNGNTDTVVSTRLSDFQVDC